MSEWETPKLDWNSSQQGVGDGDFNRIEGNTQYLKDGEPQVVDTGAITCSNSIPGDKSTGRWILTKFFNQFRLRFDFEDGEFQGLVVNTSFAMFMTGANASYWDFIRPIRGFMEVNNESDNAGRYHHDVVGFSITENGTAPLIEATLFLVGGDVMSVHNFEASWTLDDLQPIT
jgi:hypothetical protein